MESSQGCTRKISMTPRFRPPSLRCVRIYDIAMPKNLRALTPYDIAKAHTDFFGLMSYAFVVC